jgi:SH3-like domain-containing protein
MKRYAPYIPMAGLVCCLTLAVAISLWAKQSKKDEVIMGWAHSLVWVALGGQVAPEFFHTSIERGAGGRGWVVKGKVKQRYKLEASSREPYVAIIERVCGFKELAACWRLTDLEITGRKVALGRLQDGIGPAAPDPYEPSTVAPAPVRVASGKLEKKISDPGLLPAGAFQKENWGVHAADPRPERQAEPVAAKDDLPDPLVALPVKSGKLPREARSQQAAPGPGGDRPEGLPGDLAIERHGSSGLPAPRFVSLRATKVNLRSGPGLRYGVDWIYQRKGLPVELLGASADWRRIRDHEGTQGWVHQSMLSGERSVLVIGAEVILRRAPDEEAPGVTRLEPGVIAQLASCMASWCQVSVENHSGWLSRRSLYGLSSRGAVGN